MYGMYRHQVGTYIHIICTYIHTRMYAVDSVCDHVAADIYTVWDGGLRYWSSVEAFMHQFHHADAHAGCMVKIGWHNFVTQVLAATAAAARRSACMLGIGDGSVLSDHSGACMTLWSSGLV